MQNIVPCVGKVQASRSCNNVLTSGVIQQWHEGLPALASPPLINRVSVQLGQELRFARAEMWHSRRGRPILH